jgi:hypothetical protein
MKQWGNSGASRATVGQFFNESANNKHANPDLERFGNGNESVKQNGGFCFQRSELKIFKTGFLLLFHPPEAHGKSNEWDFFAPHPLILFFASGCKKTYAYKIPSIRFNCKSRFCLSCDLFNMFYA